MRILEELPIGYIIRDMEARHGAADTENAMKTYALKDEAATSICNEIAAAIGQEPLTTADCAAELNGLEGQAAEAWQGGDTGRFVAVEISQHYTLSGRPELVRAYFDDFDCAETADE